ncbi:helix-turn-helix domain-containing protein [Mycobacterium camsae]|uniref:hypothetical protein n=1 Tax=Mycobacterium gordonae TaxID=1778 RepID=UPI00197CCB73|nr:hypothetical protein [Mycobacterium gordonae]
MPFTDREREIVMLIGAGLPNRAVAGRLTLSVRTWKAASTKRWRSPAPTTSEECAAQVSHRGGRLRHRSATTGALPANRNDRVISSGPGLGNHMSRQRGIPAEARMGHGFAQPLDVGGGVTGNVGGARAPVADLASCRRSSPPDQHAAIARG